MITIAYAHDGSSLYDLLFMDHLNRENTVHLLTFNRDPEYFPRKVILAKMPSSTSVNSKIEMFCVYILSLLRSLVLRLYLARTKSHVLVGCMATRYGFYSALSGFHPFILIVWGSDVLVAPKRSFLFRLIVQFTLRKADAVILDSEVQRAAAIRLGCNPEKILKFPWFDLERIQVRSSKVEVRKKLGWTENPIVICLRKHDPIYGVQYVIEAIPKVVNTFPETRFLMLGAGQLTGKFKRMVNKLGIQKYVRFLGSVSHADATTYLNAADIYVSMSLSDGTSASLLEAMSIGVPSIVTNIAGNKEWIKDGSNGYLVPVKDPQQLAEKTISLLKDQDLRQQINERALKTVRAKVDWHENSTALSNRISKLVREKG